MKEALVRVDVQNDFCPGGKLAVTDGDLVVRPLSIAAQAAERMGILTVDTKDWHPEKTQHFAIWPVHCVQETEGAELHPHLYIPEKNRILILKGMGQEHGYSPFEGFDAEGKPFLDVLRDQQIDKVVVGGLATDYCVKNMVLDALKNGFSVDLMQDAIRAVNLQAEDGRLAVEEMQEKGARLVSVSSTLRRWNGQ